MRLRDLVPWKRDDHAVATQQDASTDPFTQLHRQMSRLLDDAWGGWGFGSGSASASYSPAIDVRDTDSAIEVRAEVPGMGAEDVHIDIRDGLLTISGEKKSEDEREDGGRTWRECRWGSFQRQVSLPAEVDEEHATATVKDGVLSVSLPKMVPRKPTRIVVKKG